MVIRVTLTKLVVSLILLLYYILPTFPVCGDCKGVCKAEACVLSEGKESSKRGLGKLGVTYLLSAT